MADPNDETQRQAEIAAIRERERARKTPSFEGWSRAWPWLVLIIGFLELLRGIVLPDYRVGQLIYAGVLLTVAIWRIRSLRR